METTKTRKPHIVLNNFEILRPTVQLSQSDSLEFLASSHQKASEDHNENLNQERLSVLIKRFGVKPTQIGNRGLESLEMSSSVPSIYDRTKFFGKRGNELLKEFYQEEVTPPSHLIHVTCTGYISPSPAQHLVQTKKWKNTRVTHAYHMGCYASIPAVRMAEGFIASGETRSDIVHTEMCSLHLNPKDHSSEQLVVQSLFADGYIKYSAIPAHEAKEGFAVKTILERIIPDTEADMTWQPAEWGMQMSLSRDVPEKIGSQLRSFVTDLCAAAGEDLATILKEATFAVHPGGPKIIDAVQTILELSNEQVAASKKILFEYGNMSSATLPHVWKEILETAKPKKKVLSLAFGPGLTIFGALFEVL